MVEISYWLAIIYCLWEVRSEDPLSQVSGSGSFHDLLRFFKNVFDINHKSKPIWFLS